MAEYTIAQRDAMAEHARLREGATWKQWGALSQRTTPAGVEQEAANVARQALAGMLWSKQFYFLDAGRWLTEHGADPILPSPRAARNREWFHMLGSHIISMPDKWEYPWFAAWDLAFHAIALAVVDVDFAKRKLGLLLDQTYLGSE